MLRAEHEAAALERAAAEAPDVLDAMLARRLRGEPLARIVGAVDFCGLRLALHPDVYVPRWTSEQVARAAIDRLPSNGVAVDLCTGCGAVAAAIAAVRSAATVFATDLHAPSVACARANGVDAHTGDLFAPLPHHLRGAVDVVVAVPPFVPNHELDELPTDVLAHERVDALDGGAAGLAVIDRIAQEAPDWLRPGGSLVVELGPRQQAAATTLFERRGYVGVTGIEDGDGDPCGVAAIRPGGA